MMIKNTLVFLLLLLLLICVSACSNSNDPAAEFFEYMRFHFYDLGVEEGWQDPDELERQKSCRSWYRDKNGKLYSRLVLSGEAYDLCLSRDTAVPLDDSGRYTVEVLDFPNAMGVRYKVQNQSDEELRMPRYCVWDVKIDDEWYLVFETKEAHISNHDDPLLMPVERLDFLAPGESQEQTIWDRWYYSDRLPGHYRICLSHDGENWVVTEFDITEEAIETAVAERKAQYGR